MGEHRRGEDLVGGERRPAPRMRRERAVRERLHRDLGERLGRNPVIVHVSLEFGSEELRRHHQPVLAVPLGKRPVRRVVLERAPRMLVEADDETDVVYARLERAHRGDERRASRGASVLHVGEREAGRAEARRPSCRRCHRPHCRRTRTACRSRRAPRRRALPAPRARPSAALRPPRAGRTDGSRHRETTISFIRGANA